MNNEKLVELIKKYKEIKKRNYYLPYIFNKERDENFISDWLAYILDSNINGLGNEPINALLKASGYDELYDDEKIDFNSRKDVREYQLSQTSRIDLLIPVQNHGRTSRLIAIENKIDSNEGFNQTQKYYEEIEKMESDSKCYIFLHLHNLNKISSENFKQLSYRKLIGELEKIDLSKTDERNRFIFKEFILYMKECINMKDKQIDFGEMMDFVDLQEQINSISKNLVNINNDIKDYIKTEIIKIIGDYEVVSGNGYVYFEKGWNKKNTCAHYEIVVTNSNTFFGKNLKVNVELHVEGNNKTELRKILEKIPLPPNSIKRNYYKAVCRFELGQFDLISQKEIDKLIMVAGEKINILKKTYEKTIVDYFETLND